MTAAKILENFVQTDLSRMSKSRISPTKKGSLKLKKFLLTFLLIFFTKEAFTATEYKIEYEIDGKPASAQEYQDFMKNLLPKRYREFSERESEQGHGNVGYELKDKEGNTYKFFEQYRNLSKKISIESLKKEKKY